MYTLWCLYQLAVACCPLFTAKRTLASSPILQPWATGNSPTTPACRSTYKYVHRWKMPD